MTFQHRGPHWLYSGYLQFRLTDVPMILLTTFATESGVDWKEAWWTWCGEPPTGAVPGSWWQVEWLYVMNNVCHSSDVSSPWSVKFMHKQVVDLYLFFLFAYSALKVMNDFWVRHQLLLKSSHLCILLDVGVFSSNSTKCYTTRDKRAYMRYDLDARPWWSVLKICEVEIGMLDLSREKLVCYGCSV